MATEIERKFLVIPTQWQQVVKPIGQVYRQGYLVTDPNRTIRVRLVGTKAYLTIKGLTIGATRPEYEYEIPAQDAVELLDHFSITELSKTRYLIPHNNKIWEVDEFLDDNSGLIIAEIELSSEEESFDLPDWIDKEVTAEKKYYNANLATEPYKNWASS